MDNMQRARELAAANDVIGPRPDDVPPLYWLDLRDRIAVALDAAERRGREQERDDAAKFSQKWLEDWGMDLQATCDKYREASRSGRFDGRRIPEDMAKTFAHEFSERADAVYECGEQLASAIRTRGQS